MEISSSLYVSESLEKKKDKIIKKIKANKKFIHLYVITNAAHKDNLFDIYNYNQLFQKVFHNYYDLTIYGIAKNQEEAYQLVEQMIQDCVTNEGTCDVSRYLA